MSLLRLLYKQIQLYWGLKQHQSLIKMNLNSSHDSHISRLNPGSYLLSFPFQGCSACFLRDPPPQRLVTELACLASLFPAIPENSKIRQTKNLVSMETLTSVETTEVQVVPKVLEIGSQALCNQPGTILPLLCFLDLDSISQCSQSSISRFPLN